MALPKGRLYQESISYFAKNNIGNINILSQAKESRKLIHCDDLHNVEYLQIRSQDIGTYVEQGVADIAILGYDILMENNFQVYIAGQLPFGYCNLSIAYLKENKDWITKKHIKVATKYPHLTHQYFYQKGYNIEMIKLYGSIEIAPITGIADVIVDLVSTGKTLKENNLIEGSTLFKSQACFIINPVSYVFKKKQLFKYLNLIW